MFRAQLSSPSALRRVKDFVCGTEGTVTIESLFALPLLVLWYVASLVFFDGFHFLNIQEKAAYTISDLISREQETAEIDQAYIDGMNDVFDYLVNYEGNTWIRVTSVTYDSTQTTNKYRLEWSGATNGQTAYVTHAELNTTVMQTRLPTTIGADESVILVETSMVYNPPFNVGLAQQTFGSFIFTPPRFALAGLKGPTLAPSNPGS